ncbi:MAG: phosphoribosyltransferase family protein, partial [Fulvivirga sp.]|uniref:phosphoribosyltransferase family protein n=1 Tax=Fulvivirga sp. TaxID=1931237 RepID=UPI0032ECDA95
MKIIKLTDESFYDACTRLAIEINKFNPEVIIGIETGGAEVARAVLESLAEKCHFATIKIQRKSTNTIKSKGIVRALIKRLPEFIVRILRMYEMTASEIKAK